MESREKRHTLTLEGMAFATAAFGPLTPYHKIQSLRDFENGIGLICKYKKVHFPLILMAFSVFGQTKYIEKMHIMSKISGMTARASPVS